MCFVIYFLYLMKFEDGTFYNIILQQRKNLTLSTSKWRHSIKNLKHQYSDCATFKKTIAQFFCLPHKTPLAVLLWSFGLMPKVYSIHIKRICFEWHTFYNQVVFLISITYLLPHYLIGDWDVLLAYPVDPKTLGVVTL